MENVAYFRTVKCFLRHICSQVHDIPKIPFKTYNFKFITYNNNFLHHAQIEKYKEYKSFSVLPKLRDMIEEPGHEKHLSLANVK